MNTLPIHQQNVLLTPPVFDMDMVRVNDDDEQDTVNTVNSNDFVHKPTHTDVLLGRGVGTNRHAGNINFREIVTQWIVSANLSCCL